MPVISTRWPVPKNEIAIFRSRLDEGLTLMEQELAINPTHAMALYRIGDIYSRQLKWERAIAALQQSLWINPYFSGPYILLGKAYSKTSQLEAAEVEVQLLREADEHVAPGGELVCKQQVVHLPELPLLARGKRRLVCRATPHRRWPAHRLDPNPSSLEKDDVVTETQQAPVAVARPTMALSSTFFSMA